MVLGSACGALGCADAAPSTGADGGVDASADSRRDVPLDRALTRDTGAVDLGPSCAPEGYLRMGPVSSFALNTWVFVDPPGVFVGHDAGGLFVYSALCTHSRCVIPPPRDGASVSRCACHGSEFDANGRRLSGPARSDLAHYATWVCEGVLFAHETLTVASDTRRPV